MSVSFPHRILVWIGLTFLFWGTVPGLMGGSVQPGSRLQNQPTTPATQPFLPVTTQNQLEETAFPEGRPTFRCFSSPDGIPQMTIQCMACDARGYLWVGTQDGAAYYNGRTWTPVHMPNRTASNYVLSLATTRDGSIWFGTNGAGLARLKDEQWTVYDTRTQTLPSDQVFFLLETITPAGESILWVGTDGGLVQFAQGKWTASTPKNSKMPGGRIRALAELKHPDNTTSLWVSFYGNGLACLRNGEWTHFTPQNSPLPQLFLRGLCAGTSFRKLPALWIGTIGGGLACLELQTRDGNESWNWTIINSQNSPLPNDSVWSVLQTTSATGTPSLWLGTMGSGLVHIEPQPAFYSNPPAAASSFGAPWFKWSTFNTQTSTLPENQVISLLEPDTDQKRVLWVGTAGGGLARLDKSQWKVLDPTNSPLPDKQVWAFLESVSPRGRPVFWVGTGNGLVRYESGQWTTFTTSNSGLPNNIVSSLAETVSKTGERTLWVGTSEGGLATFLNEQWTVYNTSNSPLKSNNILCVLPTVLASGETVIWIGSNSGGLSRFQQGVWTVFDTTSSSLPHDSVFSLLVTRGLDQKQFLWVGTRGGGVARIEIDSLDKPWKIFNTSNSKLPSNYVLCLLESVTGTNSFLWIGTGSGGVCRLNPDVPDDPWVVMSDATSPALPNNIIYRMAKDQKERLYFCTNKGITRLTAKNPADLSITNYDLYTFDTNDGLPSEECNTGASVVDSRGYIWVGTVKGVGVYNPNLEINSQLTKPLIVERAWLNGKEVQLPELTSLQHNQNNLLFEFALLSFTHEATVRYQVQLEGFDPSKSDWTTVHRKEYTNLGAGNYTFRVWGQDYTGQITGPVSVSVKIRPAPWNSWWAYLIYLGLFGSGIYGLYSWRIHTLNQRQQEKIVYLGQLLESTRLINSQLDLMAVFRHFAVEAARLVNGVPGGIGLVQGNEVVFKLVFNHGQWEPSDLRFEIGKGITGQVAATAKSMILNDVKGSPLVTYPELIEKHGVSGFMNIPIIMPGGHVGGVISIHRSANRKPFTEADCRVVEALASQAAVAIENAALHGEVEDKNLQLEEKNLMIVESIREIERLYQNEQQVNRTLQELNQMKTNFIIVTSHEMRTPLTVIKGYADALLAEYLGPLTETQNRAIAACQRMVDRMVTSFDGILMMLKIDEGKNDLTLSRLDLSTILSEVVEELSSFVEKRGQKIIIDAPEGIILLVDREKIKLVFLNLVQNAIKFTYDKGTIQIRVTIEGSFVHIQVQDSGIGIEPTEIDRVFERFYTSNDPSTHTSGRFEFTARGTGLGLSVAKSYIEFHGGKIWAESAGVKKGSCFHVQLPLASLVPPVSSTTDQPAASTKIISG